MRAITFRRTRRLLRALLGPACAALGLSLLGGCSFGVFSDLEDEAPAARINQDDSEISSSSFGDFIVGLAREAGNEGGVLAIIGNGDSAFATATVAGGVRVAHAERSEVKDNLDAPIRITSMAAAPSEKDVDGSKGPFAWVGSTSGEGAVRVIDVLTFKRIGAVHKAPMKVLPVTEFGAAVTAANLDDTGGSDDLAVGAKSALVLIQADNSAGLGWPSMKEDTPLTVAEPGGGDWPSGSFSVIAAGNLDENSTPEDEVVAAVPEKNAVVVIHHIAECFKDTDVACKSYIRVRAPDADRFGASLLVADVDDDSKPELVVGAPGVNKVYVYDLEKKHFDLTSPAKLPDPTVLTPGGGADAREFGASLAFGKLDGVKKLLAVGAPSSVVGGTSSAGRIHLYDTALKQVGEGVVLATPEDKTLLGRNLAVIPYSKSGAKLDVLAAAGREAVFVFFANLTSEHKDIRK
jgi:hypothetical protein